MRKKLNRLLVLVVVLVAQAVIQAHATEDHWKALQSLPFPGNYPTPEAAQRLNDEMLFHRATQVVGWSLPAMTL